MWRALSRCRTASMRAGMSTPLLLGSRRSRLLVAMSSSSHLLGRLQQTTSSSRTSTRQQRQRRTRLRSGPRQATATPNDAHGTQKDTQRQHPFVPSRPLPGCTLLAPLYQYLPWSAIYCVQKPFTRPFRPSSTAAPFSLYATPVSMCNVWPTNPSLPPFLPPLPAEPLHPGPDHTTRACHALFCPLCSHTHMSSPQSNQHWWERQECRWTEFDCRLVLRGHDRCSKQRRDCANCVVRRGGHVSTEVAHSSASCLPPCCRRCLLSLRAAAFRLVCPPVCFAALRAAVAHRTAAAAAPQATCGATAGGRAHAERAGWGGCGVWGSCVDVLLLSRQTLILPAAVEGITHICTPAELIARTLLAPDAGCERHNP